MKYADEGMDCKKILLLFLKKIWVIILAAVLGAAIGGGIYLLRQAALSGNREYSATSKLYLYFTPSDNEDTYQSYNGYTWNDLMSTNRILDTTMSYLPESYTEEEVIAATKASILSDIRILTITVTTHDPDKTTEILKATDRSIVEMGDREEEFDRIEVIAETDAKPVTADSRLRQAVLAGFVSALILAIILMALIYVLDDRIYVPGDLKCITELPFIGFCFEHVPENVKKPGEEALLKKLQDDMELNRAHIEKINGVLDTMEIGQTVSVTEEVLNKMRKADGIILALNYGKTDRASLAYRIEQLTLQGCKITGISIRNADMRFIRWYYNRL